LPSTFDPAMQHHQYVQQTNQVIAKETAQTVYTDVGPKGNLYGIAPNYGCCTANYHQGWPKFTKHLWMKSNNSALAAVVYAPNKFTTTIADATITIETRTDYPFGNGTIMFIITSNRNSPVNLLLRIPAWSTNVTLTYMKKTVQPQAGIYYPVTVSSNSTITLNIPMIPRIEKHYKNAVSVHRGPLLFSLQMADTITRKTNCKVAECDDPYDFELTATTKWNYALKINTSDLQSSITFQQFDVSSVPFDPAHPPVVGYAKGREVVEWVLDEKVQAASDVPQSPVKSTQPEIDLQLVPFGSTNLRVAMFPVLSE
jgi:DUF1680 family protein